MSATITKEIELRLRNQLDRAFRHTFGSEQGLRVLVRLATEQMLASGLTRPGIRAALSRMVNEHPSSGIGRPSLLNGCSRAEALTTMMLRWSDVTPTLKGSPKDALPLHKYRT